MYSSLYSIFWNYVKEMDTALYCNKITPTKYYRFIWTNLLQRLPPKMENCLLQPQLWSIITKNDLHIQTSKDRGGKEILTELAPTTIIYNYKKMPLPLEWKRKYNFNKTHAVMLLAIFLQNRLPNFKQSEFEDSCYQVADQDLVVQPKSNYL